jgi:hypothetical protein
MALTLSILYRGPLASCNYACGYCPFAKRRDSAAQLAADRDALERFVAWILSRPEEDRISVLFTPWGEALTRRWYREALVRLSHAAPVGRVAIQTNLSVSPIWAEPANRQRLALWATYHPSEVSRAAFLDRCQALDRMGVRYSVGIVGLREHVAEAEALRRELSPDVYLWVNAFKSSRNSYIDDDLRRLEAVDPLFPINTVQHVSLGHACRTGHSVISVDGDGTMRRCHFVREPIGNLYGPEFERGLVERSCPNATCGCHIGYVHLDRLGLGAVFGDGILERIPSHKIEPVGSPTPGRLLP